MATSTEYRFPGVVTRVVDGDTIVAEVLVAAAFHETWKAERVWRLNGCNARELRDPTGGGRAAKANLEAILPIGLPVVISSVSVDPYTSSLYESARYEATVTLSGGVDLVTLLVTTGWAAAWDGVTQPRPLPPWPRQDEAHP